MANTRSTIATCRPALAATAILASLLTAAARAQTTTYYPGQAAVQVEVTASVGGRCGFAAAGAPSGTFNQPNFDATGFTHDFSFTLDCTGPARMAVVSSNGGLLTAGTAPSGYSVKAPYDVLLNMVGNGAGNIASATCTAATLTTGSTCSFLGPVSTTQGLRLASPSTNQTGSYLRVSAPAYAGASQLVAGTYADTLTVTLTASP